MKISTDEQAAIQKVCRLADLYGYGNLICHLQSAWMAKLVADGLPVETAKEATLGREPYPLDMHRDLREGGWWDETGKRYSKASEQNA